MCVFFSGCFVSFRFSQKISKNGVQLSLEIWGLENDGRSIHSKPPGRADQPTEVAQGLGIHVGLYPYFNWRFPWRRKREVGLGKNSQKPWGAEMWRRKKKQQENTKMGDLSEINKKPFFF